MTHNSRGLSELDLEELTGGYVLLLPLAGSCSTSIKVLRMKEMWDGGINKQTCFTTHAAKELQFLGSKPQISRFLWNRASEWASEWAREWAREWASEWVREESDVCMVSCFYDFFSVLIYLQYLTICMFMISADWSGHDATWSSSQFQPGAAPEADPGHNGCRHHLHHPSS